MDWKTVSAFADLFARKEQNMLMSLKQIRNNLELFQCLISHVWMSEREMKQRFLSVLFLFCLKFVDSFQHTACVLL